MAHLSQEHVQHLYETFGDLKVLDDIIRHRAADEPPLPILGYPRYEHSVDDYELFTSKQLDYFVDAAAKHFISNGFWPVILFGPLLIPSSARALLILKHRTDEGR